jgi:hypothetical protein
MPLVWVGIAWMSAAYAEPARGPRLVGPDAVLYVELNRPADLIDRVDDERFQKVLTAAPPYAQALQQDAIRQIREVATVVTGAVGTTVPQAARDLTGGGIILAVEGTDKPDKVYILVTPKDPDLLRRTHDKLAELARKDASDKGKPDPIKEDERRGIKRYSVSPTEAHAIVGDTLIVANGPATVDALIDRALDEKGAKSIADDATWKARRDQLGPDTVAWAFARLDRLRRMDPKKYSVPDQVNPGATLLFGDWIEALRKAPWVSASLSWSDGRLGAGLTIPTPEGGLAKPFARYVPPRGSGAPAPLNPPGTIASLGLWRDLSALWEVRADLLPPEAQQGLAQLDTTAGTFFGGRDFGTGVLGALGNDWRLVVASQDPAALDPVPDVKLPAFALVIPLKPEDEEFATRLRSAFQSFIGLVNLGSAQSKAPPLMLSSENLGDVTVYTSKFLPSKDKGPAAKGEPVHTRHNFSPSAAQVGSSFVLSSSLGLAKDLVKALKEPAKATEATVVARADGAELAKLVDRNKGRMAMQNMIEKGNSKDKAEEEIAFLSNLLRYLGRASLTAQDRPDSFRLRLDFALDQGK